MNDKRREYAKGVIAPFLGKTVIADLNGKLFDHVPATFRFRFQKPGDLAETLADSYEDELGSLKCLEDGEWVSEDLIPIASVSSGTVKEGWCSDFAWIFLDWSKSSEPRVLVTTTDYWSRDREIPGGLKALGLKIIEA